MADTVVVLDIESLKEYHQRLSALKAEVSTKGQKLNSLADQLTQKATSMASITSAQGSNWQDPQYETLKEAITPCVQALRTNADMMKETTSTIERTLSQVDSSLAYLAAQITKIEIV